MMISNQELEQAKTKLLSGQVSLRQLSVSMNIDRDALKNMIKEICTPEEEQSLQKVLEEVIYSGQSSSCLTLSEVLSLDIFGP